MIRNLRILGVALVGAVALCAAAASSASAQPGVFTSDGPVTWTGTETSGENKFEMFGIVVQCPGSTYAGHKVAATPHAFIPNGATEVTITPKFVNCKVGKNAGDIEMHGCDFELWGPNTTVTAGTYTVMTDIVCPTGAEIIVEGGLCKVHVPAQVGLAGLFLTNTPTADDIDLVGSITNVTAESCLGNHTEAAVFKADLTIKGHDSSGANTGVTITD